MNKAETIQDIHELLSNKKNIIFVPTMGNLHEGHLSLVDKALSISKTTVISIFINPNQFNSIKDLENYPRTPDSDIELLKQYKNLILFMPNLKEIYPDETNNIYDLPMISKELCGKFRPGHFNGVITIIDRLFDLITPDVAIFGKKDYQQLFLIKHFAEYNYPKIKIIGGETIRNKNGLAMSSRNNLFAKEHLTNAANLYKTLQNIVNQVKSGHNKYSTIVNNIKRLEKY